MLKITVMGGHFQGLSVDVPDSITLGRGHDCGLFLPDPQVSRSHAQIFRESGLYWIRDLGSHNGTLVNEVNTNGNHQIRHGDQVRLGTTVLSIQLEESAQRTTGTAIRLEQDPHDITLTLERQVGDLAPPSLDTLQLLESSDDALKPMDGLVGSPGSTPEPSPVASASSPALAVADAKRFSTVYHLSRALQEATVPEDLLRILLEFVFQAIDADQGDVVLVGENGDVFPVLSLDRYGRYSETVRVSRTVMSRVLKNRMAILSSDTGTNPEASASESMIFYGMRSILSAPMISKDRLVGVIQVVNHRSSHAFTEGDLSLLTIFASIAAVSLENARLYERQQASIEDLKRAHEELMRAQEEMVHRERLASIGRMASGIAHEIRNSLGPMALLHLIRERYPEDSVLSQYTDLMNEAHKRILTIVDEVRDFSRGQQRTESTSVQPVGNLITSVLQFMKYDKVVLARAIHTEIRQEVFGWFSPDGVKQVIINLVRNAAQAMEGCQGSIRIRVSKDPRFARIEVVDSGKGIPSEHMERIWAPFFTTKGESGMGLGLDISRLIVERYGGRIECVSEVGVGTVMTVFLPLTESIAREEISKREEAARKSPDPDSPSLHLVRNETTQRNPEKDRDDISVRELTR